jgi:PAS domain S-box-containing protein
LDCVSFAVEELIGVSDWKEGFAEVLRRLGEASQVSHVYILEARGSENGVVPEMTQHEWLAPGFSIDQHQLKMLNTLRVHQLSKRMESLSEGEVCHFGKDNLSQEDKAILAALGFESALVIPVFVERRLWGFLGLDRSMDQSEWAEHEVNVLKAAARGLGTVLARAKVEGQFRELAGNIRAVFWTSGPDGHDRTYVSPAYDEIYGQSRRTLQQSSRAWMDLIHPEDLSAVESALTAEGGFDQEYRILLPDQSHRWIRDRGFPIWAEAGQIAKMVGIAEDVTHHKEAEERIQGTTLLLKTLIDNLSSGILVEDEKRRIRHVNQVFCEMFDLPTPGETILGSDSRLLFAKSKPFADRIEAIRSGGTAFLGEELEFDGLTLSRDYVPLVMGNLEFFHLWQYQDVTEQKNVERQIKASLREKEVLLQEIHHRVKNNLQIICSLLSLQSTRIPDGRVRQNFADIQNRVRAMALVHERLHKSEDLSKVDFPGYTRNLTDHLMKTYQSDSEALSLRLEIEAVPLNIDTAIPCGLIINELVSNSLKYAFPEGPEGEIVVRLSQDGDHCVRLQVADNGIGLPEGFDFKRAQSLGLKLVNGLTEQLGGSLSYRNANGTEFTISIPLEDSLCNERLAG